MSDILIKQHLKASLPPGIFWTPYNNFDELIDAITESLYPSFDNAKKTACVRDPEESLRLLDLADEYGAEFFSNLADADIIKLVKLAKTGVKDPGAGDLQNALVSAGFDVQVHSNAPFPTNPANFIGLDIPVMVAGNATAVAGNRIAVAGAFDGVEVLINGGISATVPIIAAIAGLDYMVAGNQKAVAGYHTEVENLEYGYELPGDEDRWNNVYFIGGDAMRTASGELYDIDFVDIDQVRQSEFENLVLKYGPGESWIGMFINYV